AEALAGRRLETRILLASLASTLGGLGSAAYAAANAVLDAHAVAGSGAWRSIDWDVWQHGGGSAPLTTVRRDLADLAMRGAEGEDAFLRALGLRGVERILVSTANLQARMEHGRRRLEGRRHKRRKRSSERSAKHPRPALANPFVAPESDLERQLTEVWCGVLGFERIGTEDNFFELGGDSLLALEVVERLNEELGVELQVARLYQGLTIKALAEVIGRSGAAGQAQRREELTERRAAMDRRRLYQRARRKARGVEA
ncbi:MAG: phosphopantetheine-binding protein, partial [Acidobacteriota bacterium]